MQINYLRRGFTLIELLIVILIIGILASIALPQYQKAVEKSRLAKLKSIVNSIYQARQRYYLGNGNYATHISDLDIEWGESDAVDPTLHRLGNIVCSIEVCLDVEGGRGYVIGYRISNSGARQCFSDSRGGLRNIAGQVCQAETKLTGNSSAAGMDKYFLYTWNY